MKYFLLLFCTVVLFACKKEEDQKPFDYDPNVYMRATINGKPWEANKFGMIAGGNNIFRGIIGDTNNCRIVLCIPDTVAATYNFRLNEATSATITSFNVSKSESDWLLQWNTAQEINSKWFVIEVAVSSDTSESVSGPVQWKPADTIQSIGPGNHSYEYRYKVTGWYFNYYAFRLKMVDVNNLSQYSAVRMVRTAVSAYYAAQGQRERMGFNSNITVTGKEGLYMKGTFSFTVRLLNGELIKIENGEFICRYK